MSIAQGISENLAAALRQAGLDSVQGAFAYESGLDLNKPNLGTRRRTRLMLTDAAGAEHELYLKRYGPQSLRLRVDRIRKHGSGLSAAAVEFNNIQAARKAGVATMEALAFGQEDLCCRDGRSYLVVSAVAGDALERCADDFLSRSGQAGAEELTAKLAEIVRLLHTAGYVHRDLYAAHVFLDQCDSGASLSLIDLARMFRPVCRKRRWIVKDLAQLKYSMPPAWVEGHWSDFLAAYGVGSGGADSLNAAIDQKVRRMQRHDRRKAGS